MTKTMLTSREITKVPLDEIRVSQDNPRGAVKRGPGFNRLIESIDEAGVLVPVVLKKLDPPEGRTKYELVDGERRFRASVSLRKADIPAHIVQADVGQADLRRFMFHLHMTREQWEPLAQVKSLAEMYPNVDNGIPLAEKRNWIADIAKNTYMDEQTARDRVHVLAWSKDLRDRVQGFQDDNPEVDIYSYVLAIEASIIEPFVRAVREHAAAQTSEERIAKIREVLLNKLLDGVRTGRITARDQIRQVAVLFDRTLSDKEWKVAKEIFDRLASKGTFSFEDVLAEVQIGLPKLLAEKPAKPRRVIALMNSLAEILSSYRGEYLDQAAKSQAKRKALHLSFEKALKLLNKSITKLLKEL